MQFLTTQPFIGRRAGGVSEAVFLRNLCDLPEVHLGSRLGSALFEVVSSPSLSSEDRVVTLDDVVVAKVKGAASNPHCPAAAWPTVISLQSYLQAIPGTYPMSHTGAV